MKRHHFLYTLLLVIFLQGCRGGDSSENVDTNNSMKTGVFIVVEPESPLNDTGITWGGNYPSGNNATCIGETINQQDCSHGRDVTHNDDSDGHAGFSFTKLDSSGNILAASATQWSCVQDNITGLIWEIKTDDGGIHDKYNYYRWGGIGVLGPTSTPHYQSQRCISVANRNRNAASLSLKTL